MRTSQRVLLLAAVLTALPAQARDMDLRLSLIRRPASTHPVIRLAGETFDIQCAADAAATGWAAELQVGTADLPPLPLTLLSTAHDPATGLWTLEAQLPPDTPPELYDLRVVHDGGPDRALNAVRVYDAWPRRFRVAHFSDTQNEFAVPGIAEGVEGLIRDLNVLQPDFALVTGDMVTYGRADEYEQYVRLVEQARFPVFHVPGNHDVFWTECWNRALFQQRYEDYIGERQYDFAFGDAHLVGFELSGYEDLCPYSTITAAQQASIETAFAGHPDATVRILFGHQREWFLNPPAVGPLDALNARLGIDVYLYGHLHADRHREFEGVLNASVGWAGNGRFRLIHFEDGMMSRTTYNGTRIGSIPGGDAFTVTTEPLNGDPQNVLVTLSTTLEEDYPWVPLRLELPPAEGGHYEASGARLVRTAEGYRHDYVYLDEITIPAAGSTTAHVWWVEDPPVTNDGGYPEDGGGADGGDALDGGDPWDGGPSDGGEDLDGGVDGGPVDGGWDAGPTGDGGAPPTDGGYPEDAGAPARDGGSAPPPDDAATGGCTSAPGPFGFAPLLLALLAVRRRR